MNKRNIILVRCSHSLFVVFLILLGGCGKASQSNPPVHISTPLSHSPTPSPVPHATFFRIGNLDIYSHAGFQCFIYNDLLSGYANKNNSFVVSETSSLPHGNLVLATDRSAYDTGEIQQIAAYTSQWQSDPPLSSLPATLRWISGGPLCTLDLQITNTGKDPVTIQTPQLRLLHIPRGNTNHYHLIDFCSVRAIQPCPGAAGGGAAILGFSLGDSSSLAGTIFTPIIQIGADSLGLHRKKASDPVIVPAGSLVELYLKVIAGVPVDSIDDSTRVTGESYNLIYDLVPEFVLSTEQGLQTISLTPLAQSLFFTSSENIDCYTLKGNAFVKMANYRDYYGHFCM